LYFDCIIAGFGGQGVMLMGNILAYAGIAEKKKVTYMPVYGVEMRGGTANCTVVISDDPIGSPIIHSPLTAVVMNRPSLEKFGPRVRKGGMLFINSSLIPKDIIRVKGVKIVEVPCIEMAKEVGNQMLSNMIMLGAVAGATGVTSLRSLKKALYQALDERYHEMIPLNIRAMEKGAEFVKIKKR
jgi:2-oxoglutarate ferredoxin oxidoreductase subunit gamma